ncbi:hypothetical protein EST38_g13851 [Candolleomyces aberdarensis]|uniref:Uncharacterized protein n=1 Tax=Candolleomyces aberdarensis TaxID=2316362 RepID=A0A4Q2CYX8_9AGAR|nr:hypothetical protein EST38_g13851 [Candolleomyces aberdarensis]
MPTKDKDVLPGLKFLKLCARYTQDLVWEYIKVELETIVKVFLTAWKNPVIIENSFEELVEASKGKKGGKSRD